MDTSALAAAFQAATNVAPTYFFGFFAALCIAFTVLWVVTMLNRLFLVAIHKQTLAEQAMVWLRWVFAVMALPISYVFIWIFGR